MNAFENFPPDSKVWIYAADRLLTDAESHELQSAANQFTQSWTAHQNPLRASAIVLHNIFLVFCVDEHINQVSGCGIDKSVAFVKTWSSQLGVDFFNRTQIEVFDGNSFAIFNFHSLNELYRKGIYHKETPVANKTLTTLADFRHSFQIPFEKSWFYSKIVAASALI
jgi:hypothetical protein